MSFYLFNCFYGHVATLFKLITSDFEDVYAVMVIDSLYFTPEVAVRSLLMNLNVLLVDDKPVHFLTVTYLPSLYFKIFTVPSLYFAPSIPYRRILAYILLSEKVKVILGVLTFCHNG